MNHPFFRARIYMSDPFFWIVYESSIFLIVYESSIFFDRICMNHPFFWI